MVFLKREVISQYKQDVYTSARATDKPSTDGPITSRKESHTGEINGLSKKTTMCEAADPLSNSLIISRS
ncbi:hypothetical protein IRJ41_018743 [Triplophysa rosa]|uniref:Uncharacterized protein n=1 Tax=Triplophysa rosa TaxID=992332 RepID=A0A9W7T5Z1_TRIRA|nr:hypothetical protein IRJ41_018743 [Triplophysa rosa]